MKTPVVVLCCGVVGLVFSSGLWAQPSAGADRAWEVLQGSSATLSRPAKGPVDPAAERAARAAAFVVKADQAKEFYRQYPAHAKAGEARLAEIRSLASAAQAGDAAGEARLAATVQAVRSDTTIAPEIRVQAVAAQGFSQQMRGRKTHEERLEAIEGVARGLIVEFPKQPQGYESLLTVAATMPDERKARKLAREVSRMPAPSAVQTGAQQLLQRFDLAGKPLATELAGAKAVPALASLRAGRPTIVYTWQFGNRGSLAVAAELKKLSGEVNLIGLNLDGDPAAAAAAAQVIFVDAQGIMRDGRGEVNLKAKLATLGR